MGEKRSGWNLCPRREVRRKGKLYWQIFALDSEQFKSYRECPSPGVRYREDVHLWLARGSLGLTGGCGKHGLSLRRVSMHQLALKAGQREQIEDCFECPPSFLWPPKYTPQCEPSEHSSSAYFTSQLCTGIQAGLTRKRTWLWDREVIWPWGSIWAKWEQSLMVLT